MVQVEDFILSSLLQQVGKEKACSTDNDVRYGDLSEGLRANGIVCCDRNKY